MTPTAGTTDEDEAAAHTERMHQLARMYVLYLDDAFAWERWDEVAKWAERLVGCLRSQYTPPEPWPPPEKPRRQIELD